MALCTYTSFQLIFYLERLITIISVGYLTIVIMNTSRSLVDQESINDLKGRAYQRLVETGERERLMQVLRVTLTECGWKDKLTEFCKKVVKDKGIDNVSIDDLVTQVSPVAQKNVPPHVKQEVVKQIKAFLVKELR